MGESRAITGLDRLPWLADEGDVRRGRKGRGRVAWLVLLILAVAALSYWLGTQSWNLFPDRPPDALTGADAPIILPEARPAAPEPDIVLDPMAEPAPLPAAPIIAPTPVVRVPAGPRRSPTAKARPADRAKAATKAESSPREPWPVRKVEGSAGRLVHVGTFSTRRQAKRGWNALMRINPSLQRLPALVVPVRSKRNDKIYYRLQMGTTSQAHSVVLCQRLRMIGQSCIVLGDGLEKKAG